MTDIASNRNPVAALVAAPDRVLEPHCVQCGERLAIEPAPARPEARPTLCADCGLEGVPHTD